MASLVCRDLGVSAGGRALLDGVDLTVDDGTACVLMGPSGAGKSTLLRAVAGLVEHAGTVSVGGRDVAGVAPHRRGVGLLFQHPRLFPTMDVADNVAYPLRLRGRGRRQRRSQAFEALDEVGLTERAGAAPHELSGGEQQRVALARALCSKPDVLLLDEPLTGLDLPQRRELVRLLARVRCERKLTWVVVTHDPDDAAILGDTIGVLEAGRLVQHDTVADIRSRPRSQLVAALAANSNVLRGEVRDGVLHLGPLRLQTPAIDGPVAFTLGPDQVHLERRGPAGVCLVMIVEAVEPRGPRGVLRASSDVGSLEAPATGAAQPGSPVEVWFDPTDLWQFGDLSSRRHHSPTSEPRR